MNHHTNFLSSTCQFSTSELSSPAIPKSKQATVQQHTNQNIDNQNSLHKSTASRLSSTNSSIESGIFHDEYSIAQQSTQTNSDDFFNVEQKSKYNGTGVSNSDLCAEIQRLNKFRSKIEEFVSSTNTPSLDIGVLSPLSKLDETRLQYYRDRLELLENKVAIYESSGDIQLKRLAARLQNEIRLETQIKQYKQRVDKLEAINQQLTEERCELEEIENDTRLQLQRLEVDLEILSQRNSELEMSCETSRTNLECLQDSLNKAHDQMMIIETEYNDLQLKLELLKLFIPAILLYNTWKTQTQKQHAITHVHDKNKLSLIVPIVDQKFEQCKCNKEHICQEGEKYLELVRRTQQLTDTISDINRAYNNTLERADHLWAQMEREYNEKLNCSQEDNTLLRSKISQLEKRLKSDAHYAQERIVQLEDEENILKRRLSKLNRISRADADKFKLLQSDYQSLGTEYEKLKSYVDGPLTESLLKERSTVRTLQEELRMASNMYNDLEQLHRNQMNIIKAKLEKNKKELLAADISNSELKEQVLQLERRIIDLNRHRSEDADRIKSLAAEASKQILEKPVKPIRFKHNNRNLAQELGSFGRNNGLNAISNLNYTSVYTLNSVASKISDNNKILEVRKRIFEEPRINISHNI